MKSVKAAVIGGGSWGTALAVHLAKKGFPVRLWVLEEEVLNGIQTMQENVRYLPGISIPKTIVPVLDVSEALAGANLVVTAVPSQFLRATAAKMRPLLPANPLLVNAAKGIETETGLRLSQVLQQEIPDADVAVLSGPSHAEEVVRDIPTALVCAAPKRSTAEWVQDVFISPRLRIYTHPDIIGVEAGGALKNIIALAAGICDGLGFGDNTKAALMTRGIVEMTRLGTALGARPETFSGLSGMGDLIVTCTSMHSRNRRAGILIGQGQSLQAALDQIGMAVEGVHSCKGAYALAKRLQVEMPITERLYGVLYGGQDPGEAVAALMLRSRTHESEVLSDQDQIHW